FEQERTHTGSGAAPQRALFLEPRLDPYFGVVSLLRRSNPSEALTYAEKTKARVLLDLLHGDPIDPGAPPRLAKDEAAIEFACLENETIVFIVTATQVRTRRVALGGPALMRDVETFRDRIAQRDLRADAAATDLFQTLLGSSWPLVRDYHHLVIIPDGPLW